MNDKITFNLKTVIDINAGIAQMGDEDTFYSMMEGFDDMSLIKNISNLKEFYEANDCKLFRGEAHTLKGASGYLAAGRLYNITAQMCSAYENKNYELVFSYYPSLIEESIILRKEIKKVLSKRNSILSNRCPIYRILI